MKGGLRVLAAGPLTSVQDLGRGGLGDVGVPRSGAADPLSLRIGNRLVGNDDAAAALEMTLVGGAFEFRDTAVFALTGSDFGARLGTDRPASWTPHLARPGDVLRFEGTRGGARAYLCVRGGIAVPLVLGSASTNLRVGFGGLEGRALRPGDQLALGERAVTAVAKRAVDPSAVPGLLRRDLLRFTPGPQAEWFADDAREVFRAAAWRVSESSDRMGLRLLGPVVRGARAEELLTEGVCLGAVQIPPDGRPIVLSVEHPTTGGYPKIGNVVTADFHALGQLRPRDVVRFEPVPFETAVTLLRQQEAAIDALLG